MGSLLSPRSVGDTDKHDVTSGGGYIKAEVVDKTRQGIKPLAKKVSCFSSCLFVHKFSRS